MGLGAQAAAAQHNDFDAAKLATWQAGNPIPFGFLANTYEAIAEESKRLVITRLLVRHVALQIGHNLCSMDRLLLDQTPRTHRLKVLLTNRLPDICSPSVDSSACLTPRAMEAA